MGADNKSVFTKCGEILININTKKKKTKIYQFNCSFCSANCDQLKKFSKHLEAKHSKEFSQSIEGRTTSIFEPEISMQMDRKPLQDLIEDGEDSTAIFVPEIKVEEMVKNENKDETKKQLRSRKSKDPLQMCDAPGKPKMAQKDQDSNEVKIKNENDDNSSEDDDDDYYSYNNCDMFKNEDDYEDEDNDEGNDDEKNYDEENDENSSGDEKKGHSQETDVELKAGNKRKTKRSVNSKYRDSDDSSDDSKDADFNFDEELKIFNRRNLPPPPPKKLKPLKPEKVVNIQEPEIEIDENALTIALFQAFEKQPTLWDVEKRIINKSSNQTAFEELTKEVNEKLNCNLKYQDARKRILQMRFDYSVELEKQRKGQEHEIPWYAEHMKYLQENIEVLLKGRYELSKYRPLKTMDDTELIALIELYKKYDNLWQVNSIAFGNNHKRDEVLKKIIEELRDNHNLDVTAENLHRRINYMLRLYSKNKKLQLKCELEKREFTPSSPHYERMSFLSDCQGPFMCPNCNEIIERYDNYHIHVAKHTNVMPFKCPLCPKEFKKFNHYISHARRHLGINNFYCNICGKDYPVKTEYDFHYASHTGEKPFLCQICGESFRVRHKFSDHVRRHENRFRFECHICKRGFNWKYHYKEHVNSHLNIRNHVCSICGNKYLNKRNLSRHLQTHELKYQCNVCNKKFSLETLLQNHQRYVHHIS